MAKINQKEEFIEKFDEAGISTSIKKDYLSVTLTPKEFNKSNDLISDLLLKAVDNYQG